MLSKSKPRPIEEQVTDALKDTDYEEIKEA